MYNSAMMKENKILFQIGNADNISKIKKLYSSIKMVK
jgi:hypothetical protein